MTEEENPYAPPKSADFRLPEQGFLPTKGQRITRIVLGTLLVPLLMVVELFLIVGDEYREIADIPFLLLLLIVSSAVSGTDFIGNSLNDSTIQILIVQMSNEAYRPASLNLLDIGRVDIHIPVKPAPQSRKVAGLLL